ncbi:MAG TPA: cysteine--tRNA ligase, partial [Candidatus Nanoarchaeia archaeon]
MADIFLTNTLTRKKEKFSPIDPKKVGIYSCGPTVYRDVHIGNLRTYLAADILKRILLYNGYKVQHIKNITDVGHMRTDESGGAAFDPVIVEALNSGKTPQQIAAEYTKKFFEDEKRLNILPADVSPKASEHIKEMIELTKTLVEKSYAYETDGNVYFNVKKFAKYGQLSGNTLDKTSKLLEAVRVATETDKKDSADFALWKKAEAGRNLKWDSPWGEGFPGWHIECSAMSMKYLGNHFDIHTGGEDNVFPHHEDEIAQSEAAISRKVVNYWIHAGFLLVDGKKMARREGNVYTVADIIRKGFNP